MPTPIEARASSSSGASSSLPQGHAASKASKQRKAQRVRLKPPKPPRVELDVRRSVLERALGSRVGQYWLVVRRFLCAALSKAELDEFVARLLGREVHLHNNYFMAVLNNTRSVEVKRKGKSKAAKSRRGGASGAAVPLTPSTPSGKASKRRRSHTSSPASQSEAARAAAAAAPAAAAAAASKRPRRSKDPGVAALQQRLGESVPHSPMQHVTDPERFVSTFKPNSAPSADEVARVVDEFNFSSISLSHLSGGRDPYGYFQQPPASRPRSTLYGYSTAQVAPMDVELHSDKPALSLPSREDVHDMLMRRAAAHGLRSVSDKAVDLMMLAMETHVKNVVSSTLRHRRGVQAVAGGKRPQLRPKQQGVYLHDAYKPPQPDQGRALLSIDDVMCTLEACPTLLGQEQSFIVEQMIASAM